MASSLDLSTKTIDNNLASLRKEVEKTEDLIWLKNYNSKRIPIYSITEKQNLILDLKPKIYKSHRSKEYPRLIVNLPDPPKGYDHWIVIPIGDIHYGAHSCDYEFHLSIIEYVKNTPNVLVIFMGDLIENASKESPGASVYNQVFPPQEQKERFLKLYAPISHRILLSVEGNHGNRSVKQCFLDPEKDIANTLGVQHFSGQCFMDLICGDQKWRFYVYHGSGSAQTPMGRVQLISKKNAFYSAEFYLMGHVHDTQIVRDYELVADDTNLGLEQRKRYYVITGTCQKYFGDYAEEWALHPNKVDYPIIKLHCNGSTKPGDYEAILRT